MSTAIDFIGAVLNPSIAQAVEASKTPVTTQNALDALFRSLGLGLPKPAPGAVSDDPKGLA